MAIINIIGAGKLGKTLGHLIVKHHLATIGGVLNTSLESSREAANFITQGTPIETIDLLPAAEIYLISTPDDLIQSTVLKISASKVIKQGSIFLHCSGVLTSDVFAAIRAKGGYGVTLHPMYTFANPEVAVISYPGTFCAIEGDKEALPVIAKLFTDIGSKVYEINKSKKILYHAGAVFASNYLVALAEQALDCFNTAEVEESIAKEMTLKMMKSTLQNMEFSSSFNQALTGPIQRGDIATVQQHMSAIPNNIQHLLYSALGLATLGLTSHTKNVKSQLETILSIKKLPPTSE